MRPLSLLPLKLRPAVIMCTILLMIPANANSPNKSCPSKPSGTPTNTSAIPLFDLAPTLVLATRPQDAVTVTQILNTLSLYPLAIDGKNFPALSEVFAADVITNYSAPLNVLTPLSSVQAALEQSLAPVDTQHAYGTQIVEVLDACRARSVSYFTASHFGKGSYSGQVSVWHYSLFSSYFLSAFPSQDNSRMFWFRRS